MINLISKNLSKGRRNIPRYLYHLTNNVNYTSMLKNGYIKISKDFNGSANLSGVFMVEMTNFIKNWVNSIITFDGIKSDLSLAKALLAQVGDNNSHFVLLRIPTKNLDIDKLFCRVQSDKNSEYHEKMEIWH